MCGDIHNNFVGCGDDLVGSNARHFHSLVSSQAASVPSIYV